MTFNPPIGDPPAVQFLGVERLQVDDSYQRDTSSKASQRLIQAMAERWDWRLCTPLLISSRDGRLYIIDGQHRWAAAKLRGDIQHLPCAVGNYAGSVEEAAMFVAANRQRVRVHRMDMFRAALACGDEATATIDRLVREAGLSIAASPSHAALKAGELLCTAGLYTALKVHGPAKLSAALTQIGEAFGNQVMTYSGVIFAAVLTFFTNPPEGFDPDCLGEALTGYTADEWANHPAVIAETGGAQRATNLRKVILELMEMLEAEEVAEREVAAA